MEVDSIEAVINPEIRDIAEVCIVCRLILDGSCIDVISKIHKCPRNINRGRKLCERLY